MILLLPKIVSGADCQNWQMDIVMLQLPYFLAALTLNGVTPRLITFLACLLRISLLWSKFDSTFVAFYWPEAL